jgi:hypothetical protein
VVASLHFGAADEAVWWFRKEPKLSWGFVPGVREAGFGKLQVLKTITTKPGTTVSLRGISKGIN